MRAIRKEKRKEKRVRREVIHYERGYMLKRFV
jgi:hypothetical protein